MDGATTHQEVVTPSPVLRSEGQLLPAVREPARGREPPQTASGLPAIPEVTVKKIATAIAAVMSEVGTVAKMGFNEFHRYRYAAMQDVLQHVTPLLAKHGLCIIQTEIGRTMFDGDRVVAIQYAFTILHTSGEVWPERPVQTGMCRCRDSKGGFDDKAANKCHTAARKYFILALFQIATGEEDDADREDKPRTRPIPSRKAPPPDLNDEIPDYSSPPRAEAVADDGAPRLQAQPGGGAPAEPPAQRFARFKQELETSAEGGTEDLRRAWLLIPPSDRRGEPIEEVLRACQKRAIEVDAAKEM